MYSSGNKSQQTEKDACTTAARAGGQHSDDPMSTRQQRHFESVHHMNRSITCQHRNGAGHVGSYRRRSVRQINWCVTCISARQEIRNSGANDGTTTVVRVRRGWVIRRSSRPARRPLHPEEASAYRDYNLRAQVKREVHDTRAPAIAKVTYGTEIAVIPRAY